MEKRVTVRNGYRLKVIECNTNKFLCFQQRKKSGKNKSYGDLRRR